MRLKKNRILYLDLLRIFSIYLVIIAHTCTLVFFKVEAHSKVWNLLNFYDSCTKLSVSVFLMISGSLILSAEKIEFKKIKNKTFRVLFIYVLWSFIYSLIDLIIWISSDGFSSILLKPWLYNLINGHYHLWYLIMLVGVYILSPYIALIVNNEQNLKSLLLILFFISVLPSTILSLPKVNALLSGLINLHINLNYIFIFVLGFYLYKYGERIKTHIYALLLISGIIITILGTYFVSDTVLSEIFYRTDMLNNIMAAIGLYGLTLKTLGNKKNSESNKTIISISNKVFGIYLIHPIVLERILSLGLFNSSFESCIFIPLIAVCVFIICIGIVSIINKIPLLNRILSF